MGSKRRLAKQMLPIMLKGRTPDQVWVEPFVGSGSMIERVSGPRIGSDICKYMIALLCAVQSGWEPPTEITLAQYHHIRDNKDLYPPELVAFAGFGCSFGGKFFGGYAKNRRGDNYALQAHNSLCKQAKKIQNVTFVCCDYRDVILPPQSLIYCDPPYAVTTKYRTTFDHEAFWVWCRERAFEGHTVFVSEYSAPSDIPCLLEMNHETTLD